MKVRFVDSTVTPTANILVSNFNTRGQLGYPVRCLKLCLLVAYYYTPMSISHKCDTEPK